MGLGRFLRMVLMGLTGEGGKSCRYCYWYHNNFVEMRDKNVTFKDCKAKKMKYNL
jgi:hypothetical protein